MTRFADGNARVGAIGDMQAQRVQRVSEVVGLELMAGDAGSLTDGFCIRNHGIVGNMRSGKPRCRQWHVTYRRETIA